MQTKRDESFFQALTACLRLQKRADSKARDLSQAEATTHSHYERYYLQNFQFVINRVPLNFQK